MKVAVLFMMRNNKRGELLGIPWELVLHIVLAAGAIILLTMFLTSLLPDFGKNKREATENNFNNLFVSMKENAFSSIYPIYIQRGYIVVGFNEPFTQRLQCDNPIFTKEDGLIPLIKKPAQCGQQSCLCLCENDPSPRKEETGFRYTIDEGACTPQYGAVRCFTEEDFGFPVEFAGGTFQNDRSCSLAFIGGRDENQLIYMQRAGESVSICSEQCQSLKQEAPQATSKSTEGATEKRAVEVPPSPIQSMPGKKVLLIGASHTKGDYGKKLYALLTEAGFVTKLYARGGSGPLHWVEGSTANWFVNEEVGIQIDEQGQHSEVSGAIPPQYFAAIKNTFNPDIVVISLGTNIIAYAGTNKIREDTQKLAQSASDGAQCFWVGPPVTTREDLVPKLDAAIQEIRNAAESSGCTFIDAEPYSDPSKLASDNIHFTRAGGKEIAVGVFSEIFNARIT